MKTANNGNILLQQINSDNNISFSELIPEFDNRNSVKFLSFVGDEIKWSALSGTKNIDIFYDASGNIIIDASINSSLENLYFKNGQIGLGRDPLYNYKFDIAVPENTKMTAMHIGDGVSGFSLGNATDNGFLPQIIGVGSSKDDAGLYFLGKTKSDKSSDVPLLIFDARNAFNEAVTNRPILGVTSGEYGEYKLLIKANGNVIINGINILDKIYLLEEEIKELKNKL